MSIKTSAEAKLELARSYRNIFLDGKGDVTPEGEAVLRDLERQCNWMVESMPTDKTGKVDPLQLAGAYAKRSVYKHIRELLFMDLINLKRKTET